MKKPLVSVTNKPRSKLRVLYCEAKTIHQQPDCHRTMTVAPDVVVGGATKTFRLVLKNRSDKLLGYEQGLQQVPLGIPDLIWLSTAKQQQSSLSATNN